MNNGCFLCFEPLRTEAEFQSLPILFLIYEFSDILLTSLKAKTNVLSFKPKWVFQ